MKKITELYDNCMADLGHSVESYPWENKEAYANWLVQTYHYAKHTTRLLALASIKTPFEDSSLHNRFIDHAREERNHELLLVNDLRALGYNVQSFPEAVSATCLYQSQYYWIEHVSPHVFFGYIVFLEGFGALHCKKIYDKACELYGSRTASFLKVHHQEDVDHISKAFKEIAKFTPETVALVEHSLRQTADLYAWMLKDCKSLGANNVKELPRSKVIGQHKRAA